MAANVSPSVEKSDLLSDAADVAVRPPHIVRRSPARVNDLDKQPWPIREAHASLASEVDLTKDTGELLLPIPLLIRQSLKPRSQLRARAVALIPL